jgi:hypothetical protein
MNRHRLPAFVSGFLATASLLLFTACKGDDHAATAGLDDKNGPEKGSSIDSCAKRAAGCPCSDEGAVADCGSIKEKVGDYVICSKGVRTCCLLYTSDAADDVIDG